MTAFQAVDVSSNLTTCSIVLSSPIGAIGRSQRSLRMRETFLPQRKWEYLLQLVRLEKDERFGTP